jgi:integrase
MAANCLMYWVPSQHRWLKEYRGKTYSVSCKQLGCEPTKESSRKAANDWWEKKQAEIDAALGQAKKHPAHVLRQYERAIQNNRLYAKWHRKFGDPKTAEKSEAFIDFLREALERDNPPYPLILHEVDPYLLENQHAGQLVSSGTHYEQHAIWRDRLCQMQREEAEEKAVPKENSIRAHIDDYLATRKVQALAEGKLGTFDTIRTRLNVFRRWTDPFAGIDAITEVLWERFCLHLAQQVAEGKMAAETRAGVQRVIRSFIRNRYERRFIDLPRNLTSRTLAAAVPLQEVIVFSKPEIHKLLDAASERTKLYILLALNCGFYGVDIAALKQSEVDWAGGRIRRQRTKTRNSSQKVPKVDYLLWRQTFDLLKKSRSDHPELVLLNERGKPLWSETEKNGKFNRNNNVKTAYFHLWETKFKQTKGFKPFKTLRKTAASLLETHKEYGRYAEYFLGETPRSIASRHYVKPSPKQFDAACRWLGKQLGIN